MGLLCDLDQRGCDGQTAWFLPDDLHPAPGTSHGCACAPARGDDPDQVGGRIATSISSRCSPRWLARTGLSGLVSSSPASSSFCSDATSSSVCSAMLAASSATARGAIAWIRGREEPLMQSTSSGSFSDAVKGSPRCSLPARQSARPSQNARWPSTPATLQYSLTISPSCRSLK